MFCIAAFIVFGILAIFSASYRPLAAQAWHCVVRRLTLKPCDISFGEEVKGRLIGRLLISHPRLARWTSRWIDTISFIFVLLSIWSVVTITVAGLNLWVYDTCDPSNVESCTLSGEACGIDQARQSFPDAVRHGEVLAWFAGPFVRTATTISLLPDRLRTWDPSRFRGPSPSTYLAYDPTKPDAVEVMDPGCRYCRSLLKNIHEAGLEQSHNLSYVLYPIPVASSRTGYKFPYSRLIATYIEATKQVPLEPNTLGIAPDWQLIEKIFGERPEGAGDWQSYFNIGATEDDVHQALASFLREIGFTTAEVRTIRELAASEQIAASLAEQQDMVEQDLHALKIPVFLIGGRRFDRVVESQTLQTYTIE